jgi:hypothetical protein
MGTRFCVGRWMCCSGARADGLRQTRGCRALILYPSCSVLGGCARRAHPPRRRRSGSTRAGRLFGRAQPVHHRARYLSRQGPQDRNPDRLRLVAQDMGDDRGMFRGQILARRQYRQARFRLAGRCRRPRLWLRRGAGRVRRPLSGRAGAGSAGSSARPAGRHRAPPVRQGCDPRQAAALSPLRTGRRWHATCPPRGGGVGCGRGFGHGRCPFGQK